MLTNGLTNVKIALDRTVDDAAAIATNSGENLPLAHCSFDSGKKQQHHISRLVISLISSHLSHSECQSEIMKFN